MRISTIFALLIFACVTRADEFVLRGRLTQQGPNFVVTEDHGQQTVFTQIWKPHKISQALGKDHAYWFRVQRAGKAPNYRLRLMEAYTEKPTIGQERTDALREEHQSQIEMKIAMVKAEQASYRWEPGQINSSRGVWTRTDDVFMVTSGHKPGPKAPSQIVVGRLVRADGSYQPVLPVEVRPQTVSITFRDPTAAAKAYLEPMPIYAGYQGALTCRWDDSDNHSALLVSEVGAEHHVYGTCFLNGLGGATCKGKANQPDRASIRTILQRGTSIGNHAYTHPAWYTLRSRNRQFWEAMACRAEWEALGDCCIATVAPPYNRYGDEVTIDLWLRAGHYGFINNAGRTVEKHGYADLVCDQVLAVYGTHARSEGSTLEAVRGRAGKTWAEIRKDRRIWTPNFNQYAAYRLQYEHTGVEKTVDGATARFTLYRPAVVDLNDATPLTLTIAGVSATAVDRVNAAGAAVECLERRPTGEAFAGYTFQLGHTSDQFLPQRIGLIENATNSPRLADVRPDADFPGLQGIVHYHEGKLQVRLDNRTDRPLRDVMLTYRMPLGWDKDVARHRGLAVAAGHTLEDALPLAVATDQYDLLRGRAWFYVQVDFIGGDQPGRLHLATAYRVAEAPDPRRPAEHFTSVGPILQKLDKPGAVPDPALLRPFGEKLLDQARTGQLTGWQMRDDGDTYVADFIQMDPIASNDEAYPPERRDEARWYLARGLLQSDIDQVLYFRTTASHAMVNGQPLDRLSDRRETIFPARLTNGNNEIVLATPLSISNITSVHGVEFVVLAQPAAADSKPAQRIRFIRP